MIINSDCNAQDIAKFVISWMQLLRARNARLLVTHFDSLPSFNDSSSSAGLMSQIIQDTLPGSFSRRHINTSSSSVRGRREEKSRGEKRLG